MKKVVLCFQIHQPLRLKRYRFFDLGTDHYYYDDYANEARIRNLAEHAYLPANKVLLDAIARFGKQFKVAFAISGTALDQFELYAPELIESFKAMAASGSVEFLGMPENHSLSFMGHKEVFVEEVKQHSKRIKRYFGQQPVSFFNTQMIYSNEIGNTVFDLGFQNVVTEGAKHVLGWKSPNYLYSNAANPRQRLLLRNGILSDDIAFNFSNPDWVEFPLTADKFARWLASGSQQEENLVLAIDYGAFGERNPYSSGIFDFLRYLPAEIIANPALQMATPSEVASTNQSVGSLNVEQPISWADEEKDLTAWLGNELQQEAFNKLYELSPKIGSIKDPEILMDWKYLQNSNHMRFMSTKFFSTGKIFTVANPYESPYDAFINYMNILSDFALRVDRALEDKPIRQKKQPASDQGVKRRAKASGR